MAKKSTFQTYIEYLPLRILFSVFGLLPRSAAVWFWMSTTAFLFKLVGNKWRKVGLRNLEIAFPEKTVEERERILTASIRSLGRIIGEMTQSGKMTKAGLAQLVDISEDTQATYFWEQRKLGRGTIAVGSHLGNWEIGILALSAEWERMHYLARPLDNPLIDKLFNDLRSRFGNKAISKNNSVEAAAAALNEGSILGVLPDVNMNPRFGVFVPFFSELACTTTGVAMLAIRTNALIAPTCCVWIEEKQQYKTLYGEIIEPRQTTRRREEILRLTTEFTKAAEEFIRQYPEQYFWLHRRWKNRPEGDQPLYS